MGGALVVRDAPGESEQSSAATEARLASPEALSEREASQTAYGSLSNSEAERLDGEDFTALIDASAGGLAPLPAGQRILGYPADNAAQIELGGGRRGIIESSEPIAIEPRPGQRKPIDLSLTHTDGAFEPAASAVGVRIPEHLGEGVGVVATGLSIMPVDQEGHALSGADGVTDGATVFYANAQAGGEDVIAKPTTTGFDLATMLRSDEASERLYFRLALPEGATATESPAGSGTTKISDAGSVLATIPAPSALDANGTRVPVTTTLSGDLLTLTVQHHSSTFRYPIAVDPTVIAGASYPSNWKFYSPGGWAEQFHAISPQERGQWAYEYYITQGASRIYSFSAKPTLHDAHGLNGPGISAQLYIQSATEREATQTLPEEGTTEDQLCVEAGCAVPAEILKHEANGAFFEVTNLSAELTGGFEAIRGNTTVGITQPVGPSISLNTSDSGIQLFPKNGSELGPNALYGGGRWVSAVRPRDGETGKVELKGTDPGIGVDAAEWKSPTAPQWEGDVDLEGPNHTLETGVKGRYAVGNCAGVQCSECVGVHCSASEAVSTNLIGLPDGEDVVEAKVFNATGASASTQATVKVDSTPPTALKLNGLPSGNEVAAGRKLTLEGTATDGSGSVKSSGIQSITLAIDGEQLGAPSGSCTPGPCTKSGSWTLNTSSYAAGAHTLTLTATDNAGNVATEQQTLTIHDPSPVSVGPGSVNPVTGELSLEASDVQMSAPGTPLTVGRTYSSRHVSTGATGPLGAPWNLRLADQESLIKTPGRAILTTTAGQQSTFTSGDGTHYVAPAGDANLHLTQTGSESAPIFVLRSGATTTTFKQPTGATGSPIWMPAIVEGAGGTNITTFAYQSVSGIIEPTEELAPIPAGVSCSPTLTRGCRALSFTYATSTSATGEEASEWGEFNGRLSRVSFTAWDPSKGEMTTTAVGQYAYDKQGRLRAEWDPRISPALKTTYGYDGENHVTAITPPGLQPWLLSYGTVEGDSNNGRLLSVTRPAAATALGNGKAPEATSAPTLSSTKPAVGAKISVSSNGTWSNAPLAYSYQWEDCNSAGAECAAIPGAVNQTYYPVSTDEGHTLVASVRASNGAGLVEAASAATSPVATGTQKAVLPTPPSTGTNSVWTIDYGVAASGSAAPHPMGAKEVEAWGQSDDPTEATAFFPPDEPEGWPAADYKRATVVYLDAHDRAVNLATPSGGISTTEYNEANDVIRTLSPDDRQSALAAGGEPAKTAEVARTLDTKSTYNAEGNELLSSLGPQHEVKLSSGSNVQARASTHYFYSEGAPTEGGPYDLVTKVTTAAMVGAKEEELRTTTTGYGGQNGLGWRLHKPTSTTIDPGALNLVHTTLYDPTTGNITETRLPGAGAAGEEGETFHFEFGSKGNTTTKFNEPASVAVNSSGDVYVLDTANNAVKEYTSAGKHVKTISDNLKLPRGIAIDSKGDIWIADTGNNCIKELNSKGGQIATITQTGTYELKEPQGVAVDAEGHVWVADTGNSRIDMFAIPLGETVYRLRGHFGSQGSGEQNQFEKPGGIAVGAEGNIYVADTGNNRIVEYTEYQNFIRVFGNSGNGAVHAPHGIATDSAGDVWVADTGDSRIEEFGLAGAFVSAFGQHGTGEGQLGEPQGVAVDLEGDVWVADTANDRLQEWTPNEGYAGGATRSAHSTQTIYYTAKPNSEHANCGEHAESAGLACQSQPAAQPEGAAPPLPVTTYSYNVWDEMSSETSTSGTSTKTTTDGFDGAGRVVSTSTSSNVGTALPTVSDEYDPETGVATVQRTSAGENITSVFNRLGQPTSYTDADHNTSTYTYDLDGRPETVSDGKGVQTVSYDPISGEPTKLVDSGAGTFTASYDAEGNLIGEGYPNVNLGYTLNQIGQRTGMEYVRTTGCASSCTLFKDALAPGIDGQAMTQTSSFSSQTYGYDADGRLEKVQDTPAGKGCTTRVYSFDADTNRTALTTRTPGPSGECATEGGTVEGHTYDSADRLLDAGVGYNAFGDTTTLPALDAGGSALTSTFYVDNQLEGQTQNGQSLDYKLDPMGRTRETVATGATNSTTISHYAGGGDEPAWTVEPTSGHWTREILGISGGLVAIQSNNEAPILQLSDLHGDIVATASLSATEGKLLSTSDSTEYGVPRTTSGTPRYSWLGVDERATELSSGVVAMGARSYIPQVGRFLQVDPVAGGSANDYVYTDGDPLGTNDLSGGSTDGAPPQWAVEAGSRVAEEAVARRAAEEAAARAEAERTAAEDAAKEAAYDAYWANYAANFQASFWASWNAGIAAEAPEGEPTAQWLGVFGHGAIASESIFTEGWDWVKKNVKRIITVAVGGASTAVIGGVTLVASIGCFGSESELADEAECYKIATFGAGFTVAAAGTTVKAWYALKEQRP